MQCTGVTGVMKQPKRAIASLHRCRGAFLSGFGTKESQTDSTDSQDLRVDDVSLLLLHDPISSPALLEVFLSNELCFACLAQGQCEPTLPEHSQTSKASAANRTQRAGQAAIFPSHASWESKLTQCQITFNTCKFRNSLSLPLITEKNTPLGSRAGQW